MKEQIPDFSSEGDEPRFWAEHDLTEFIDWQTAEMRQTYYRRA